ncbi:ABC transporter ATP-binding protein [Desulfovibrio sp. OttesenSCG-928-G11]|nr:ABC transporter ATP-binding protein [Desulfovibrio sp. OttesenSCG-928-G11]
MSTATEPILTAQNLVKSYGGMKALRGVSVDFYSGRMAAIMGPSGCGKSTLLLILGLLQPADSGTYIALGQDLLSLNRQEQALFRRQFFGFILQSCAVFSYSTVAENVEYPLIYSGVPRKERQKRVTEVLASVNLRGKEQSRSNQLSGGEQQRVAVARALVNRPRVLLADEPTGQLDSSNTERLMKHFRKISHDLSLGVVIVTHDPQVAEHCDIVYRLHDGLIVREN